LNRCASSKTELAFSSQSKERGPAGDNPSSRDLQRHIGCKAQSGGRRLRASFRLTLPLSASAAMPSLKDLRNGSPPSSRRRRSPRPCKWSRVRNCGARKQRRRPRAPTPTRWRRCFSNLAGASADSGQAPASSREPVPTDHLLIVCTGGAASAAGFNTSIVRLARDRAIP